MNTKWTDEEIAIIEEKAEVYTVKQISSSLKRRGYHRRTALPSLQPRRKTPCIPRLPQLVRGIL
ncbi:hypothetical protein LC653_44560 [Nostoc sp. CHAB 5784]|nr:hypothetical protein [Nostoc mirabile CHAB5784]